MLQALLLATILFTAPDAPDPRDVVEAAREYRRAHGAVPIADHDDNQHGPDENLRVGNLWYGIDLMALILTLPETADAGLTGP